MASSLFKAQKAMHLCKDHNNKKVTLYCKTCKKHTCTECVKSGHVDHDWDVLNSVANERRACLPALCRDIRGNKLPTLNTTLTANPENDEDDEFLQEVEKKAELIVETVKTLAKEKKQKYKSLNQTCGFSQSGTKEMLKYMDNITKSLDENVHTYSDFDVLEMEQEMMSTLETLESLKTEKGKVTALFLPGQLDYNALDDMIGEVMILDQVTQSTVNITETHEIQNIPGGRIRATKNRRAFIKDVVYNKIKLLDTYGKIMHTMQYTCHDFVVMDNGDHVYTDPGDKAVRVISPDGSERVVCNTDPLVPIAISKTCDGDILVSMKDERYTVTPSSRRLVQRISMTGDVLTTYEFKGDSKTRLFTYPYRTAENRNGDVCAINKTGEYIGELIILQRDGRVRATYRGQDDSAEPFNPSDVTCDSRCRIIVSVPYHFSVHQLSYDGAFLRYLLSGLSKTPACVSLCDDSLWLSLDLPDGTYGAKMYRYK